jgi:hypothetical protein
MGGIGDRSGATAAEVLELARRAGERLPSVRATVRHWEDRAAAAAAWRAAITPSRAAAGEPPPPLSALATPPAALPARAPEARPGTTVVHLWQEAATGRGGEEVEGGPAHAGVVLFAHLLRPLRALTDLRVGPADAARIAGRPARVAVATPHPARAGDREANRGHPAPSLDALGFGADRYVLGLDAEHGMLLRVEAWHHERCFARTEVTRIAYAGGGGAVPPGRGGALRLVDPAAGS